VCLPFRVRVAVADTRPPLPDSKEILFGCLPRTLNYHAVCAKRGTVTQVLRLSKHPQAGDPDAHWLTDQGGSTTLAFGRLNSKWGVVHDWVASRFGRGGNEHLGRGRRFPSRSQAREPQQQLRGHGSGRVVLLRVAHMDHWVSAVPRDETQVRGAPAGSSHRSFTVPDGAADGAADAAASRLVPGPHSLRRSSLVGWAGMGAIISPAATTTPASVGRCSRSPNRFVASGGAVLEATATGVRPSDQIVLNVGLVCAQHLWLFPTVQSAGVLQGRRCAFGRDNGREAPQPADGPVSRLAGTHSLD